MRRKPLLQAGLVGLALLSAGVVWVRGALQRQVPAQLLQQELQRALGMPVRFGAFQLSWDARLVLSGLEISEPGGAVFLRIPRARVDFDRSRALQGDLQVQGLDLQQPSLEMSGARWRRLTSNAGAPTAGREFPILVHGLTLAWKNDQGQPVWSLADWQGSLPPAPAGRWEVRLQGGPEEQLVEAQGDMASTRIQLKRFPVAALASLATGADYPNLETEARVDLLGERRGPLWDVEAQLTSEVYRGPVHLRLEEGRRGELSLTQGELSALGRIGPARLPFAPLPGGGWTVGPAQLRWHEADWKFQVQVDKAERFQASLSAAALTVGGQKFTHLQLATQGSAAQRSADFRASGRWREWPAQLRGRLQEDGVARASWELAAARGSGSWSSRSGDLSVELEPLELAKIAPGGQGRLQGRLRRQGQAAWSATLNSPALQWGGQRLERLDLRLGGSPARWSGGASWEGRPLVLSGPLAQPQIEAELGWPGLQGSARLRLAGRWPQRSAELSVIRQDLSWQGKPLPRLGGRIRLGGPAPTGDDLHLEWDPPGAPPGSQKGGVPGGGAAPPGSQVVPIALQGGSAPASWKARVDLKGLPLARLRNWWPSLPEGAVSGRVDLGWREQKADLKLAGLTIQKRKLGDWRMQAARKSGKPAELVLAAPALELGAVRLQAGSRARIAFRGGLWSIVEGRLGTTPASAFQGSLDPGKRTLNLQGKLSKVAWSGLRLTGLWSASGPWSGAQLRFQGNVAGLALADRKVGELPVRAALDQAQNLVTADIGPAPLQQLLPGGAGELRAAWKQRGSQPGQVQGSLRKASFQGRPLADAALSGTWKGKSLDPARVDWQVEPPLKLEGRIGADSQLRAKLSGQSLQALSLGYLPVKGQAFGELSYASADGWHAQAELKQLEAGGQKLGEGRVSVDYRQSLRIHGQDFDATRLALLQQRYPGLSGQLSFDVDSDGKSHRGGLKLRQAAWKNRPFPDVSLNARSAPEGVVQIENLDFQLSPPLQARGRMLPASSRLELQGALNGQSLADLTLLGGGNPPADVSAQLHGPFQLHTQGDQLDLSFQGQARALHYRGVSLGDGDLRLRAHPDLDGELLLRRPVELGQTGAVPAGLQAVLPVQGLLSALRLRGVRLSGRLEAPQVSPLWANPEVRIGPDRQGQGIQVKVGKGLKLKLPFP